MEQEVLISSAEIDELAHLGLTKVFEVTASRLDGQSTVQILVAISTMSFPFFRTYVTARTRRGERFHIQYNGNTFDGYDAGQMERLLASLEVGVTGDLPTEQQTSP